jgi:hypothetical protein
MKLIASFDVDILTDQNEVILKNSILSFLKEEILNLHFKKLSHKTNQKKIFSSMDYLWSNPELLNLY